MKRLVIPLACAVLVGACSLGTSGSHASARTSAASPHVSCRQGRLVVAAPATGHAYLGAFPGLGGTEDQVTTAAITRFTRLQRHRLDWVYFSDNWGARIRFPATAVRRIRATGAVPFIRMMPRSSFDEYRQDPRYSMASILAGDHDAALLAWARAAARVPGPLMVEFGTEVNGAWFPWNGSWNGGATTDAYGDPTWPDGPERFRDAYRHVVDLTRRAGARNLTWVFHLDASPEPDADWNAAHWYYPGDDYVDWIGFSAYGPQGPGDDYESFPPVLERGYRAAASLSSSRPLALLEFAIAAGPRWSEPAWTRTAFAALASRRYARLAGISWWSERWRNDDGSIADLRIDSSAAQLRAYRSAISARRYATRLRLRCQ